MDRELVIVPIRGAGQRPAPGPEAVMPMPTATTKTAIWPMRNQTEMGSLPGHNGCASASAVEMNAHDQGSNHDDGNERGQFHFSLEIEDARSASREILQAAR